MNVFKKLFSGKNKSEDNTSSEYLTNAYDSLGEDEDLNPDKIMDENSHAVFSEQDLSFDDIKSEEEDFKTDDNNAVDISSFDEGYDLKSDGAYSDEANNGLDYEDSLDDLGYNYFQNKAENKEVDLKDAYDSLDNGDTGRLDTTEINAAVDEVNQYISEINNENQDAVNDLSQYQFAEPNKKADDVDKDLIYSAYAPKSMRPKIIEKAYYDLDDIENDDLDGGSRKTGFSAFWKKNGKWFIGGGVAAVVVVAVIVGCVFFFSGRIDPLMGYSQTYVAKGNVIKSMSASGNVEPNARYEITSLVSGTITESPLNAGEEVKEGELVYKVDDTNAQLAVQMAENAVKRAEVAGNDTTSANDAVKIYANASGTISNLNISSGSTLSGGQIATITQANGSQIGLIPNVSGTVQSLNVKEGSTVTSGQVIATVKNTTSTTSKEGQELDVAGSKLALEQAQQELEKYKIASPIDGTILIKNAKIGDNVGPSKSDKPLMVIADMSKMKFTIEVDELEIWNIQLGQTVVITASALPGQNFSGEVTNIAGEGDKKGNGVTTYAVEITISDPGKIKSGMNVDAKIIVNSAINVMSLPERTLYESDGQNALVITNSVSAKDDTVVNPADYPNINVPDGYKLVKVQYGVSDGTNVEVTSGLAIGDTVLYKANDDGDVKSSESSQKGVQNNNSSTETSGNKSKSSSGSSGELDKDTDTDDFSDNDSDNIKSTGKSAVQEDLDI